MASNLTPAPVAAIRRNLLQEQCTVQHKPTSFVDLKQHDKTPNLPMTAIAFRQPQETLHPTTMWPSPHVIMPSHVIAASQFPQHFTMHQVFEAQEREIARRCQIADRALMRKYHHDEIASSEADLKLEKASRTMHHEAGAQSLHNARNNEVSLEHPLGIFFRPAEVPKGTTDFCYKQPDVADLGRDASNNLSSAKRSAQITLLPTKTARTKAWRHLQVKSSKMSRTTPNMLYPVQTLKIEKQVFNNGLSTVRPELLQLSEGHLDHSGESTQGLIPPNLDDPFINRTSKRRASSVDSSKHKKPLRLTSTEIMLRDRTSYHGISRTSVSTHETKANMSDSSKIKDESNTSDSEVDNERVAGDVRASARRLGMNGLPLPARKDSDVNTAVPKIKT